MLANPYQTGAFGSWGSFGTWELEQHYAIIRVRNTLKLSPRGGIIHSGNANYYRYGHRTEFTRDITRTGYTFDGWYYTGDNNKYGEIGTAGRYAKSFYAVWNAQSYSVTLDPQGGTIKSGNITSYTYGVGAKLPNALIIRRECFEFGGWYDNPRFDGTPVTKIPPTDTGNKEYWAKWIAFEIVMASNTTSVYGLVDDDELFKSNGVEFKVNTTSTSSMEAHLGYTTSKTVPSTADEVTVYPSRGAVIGLTEDMGVSVVRDKEDKEVYVNLVVNCRQFDGDNWVYYNVYVHKMTTLRFIASYEEW